MVYHYVVLVTLLADAIYELFWIGREDASNIFTHKGWSSGLEQVRFCGDVTALQQLHSSGEVSPYSVNSKGQT